MMSSLAYLPSSPTLFNSGTSHPQMSSCFLVDSPRDDLGSIYDRYAQVARLSKFSGGIGIAWSRVRSRGALIRGTNGASNGIVPFLRTLDASVAAVNQGGRRKGAACVYLEPWHPDIEEFLELRDNTGEEARRTHNLNLANWIPDEFMRRVEADGLWSLIDPDEVPELPDLWGDAFDAAYREAEAAGRYVRQVKARDLYGKMMRTLAQTGNGWMTFKDASNAKCNQTGDGGDGGDVVHLSNLCTEITEVTTDAETAVCNLGSINLAKHLTAGPRTARRQVDWAKLRQTVRTAVPFLDRVIDLTFYPSDQAAASNPGWRPVGLGVMGLQDVFFALRLPFDSPEASRAVGPDLRGDLPDRARGLGRPGGRARAAPRVQPDPGGQGRPPARPVGRRGDPAGPVGSAAEAGRPDRAAQLAADRDRPDRHHRLDRGLLRVHRAAGLQPVQARDHVRRVPPGQHRPGGGAQGPRAVEPRRSARRSSGPRARSRTSRPLPEETRRLFRTAWELPQRALIDLAAARAPFIDQSQSLNLFMATPTIGKLSSMYLHAWKSGLKTTYYLRSRPATRIQQATVGRRRARPRPRRAVQGRRRAGRRRCHRRLACSLENPETCEACQ